MNDSTVTDTLADLDDAHDTMGADKYTASFIFVTPELAGRWLDRNEKNRRFSKAIAERYGYSLAEIQLDAEMPVALLSLNHALNAPGGG